MNILEFSRSILHGADAVQVIGTFQAAYRGMGLDGFACGEVNVAEPSRTAMLAADWPKGWLDLYRRDDVVTHDPIMPRLALSSGPFTWQEMFRLQRLSRGEQKVIDLARDFGWIDGIVVPIPRGGPRFGIISMASLSRTFDIDQRDLLATYAVLFYERLRSVTAGTDSFLNPAHLTAREIECLKWAARGLSDAKIAERLGIGSATVHDHVERAKKRFSVKTRTEAVAIAVSLGIVAV